MNEAIFIGLESVPLCQEIEGRQHESNSGAEAMSDEMADRAKSEGRDWVAVGTTTEE